MIYKVSLHGVSLRLSQNENFYNSFIRFPDYVFKQSVSLRCIYTCLGNVGRRDFEIKIIILFFLRLF